MLDKLLSTLKALIESANAVGMQVWAIIILLIGGVLTVAKQHDTGSMVIGGGLALLQHKNQQ
jgi:hypothetical protein